MNYQPMTLIRRHWRTGGVVLVCLLLGIQALAWFRSAAQPVLQTAQFRLDEPLPLNAAQAIIQSIRVNSSGLSGIDLPVGFTGAATSRIHLSLAIQSSPQAAEPLARQTLTVDPFESPNLVRFNFVLPHPCRENTCFLMVTTDAEPGILYLWASARDAYGPGALSINRVPQDGDLAFQAYTRTQPISLLKSLSIDPNWQRAAWLFSTSAACLVLGWLIFNVLGGAQTENRSMGENLGIYTALGLVFPAILSYLLGMAGLPVTRGAALIGIAFIAVAGLWIVIRKVRKGQRISAGRLDRWDICLLALFCLAGAVRLLQIQDLQVPNWIDGLAHYRISASLLTKGARSFIRIYPAGFHAIAAVLNALAGGRDLAETVLLSGQWLSLICGLPFYSLARRLLSPIPALLATTLYWFALPFPAYLIAWGRYPFLLGLTLLPAALLVGLDWLEGNSRLSFSLLALLAGLALTHYNSFLLVVIFLLAAGYVLVWKRTLRKITPQRLFWLVVLMGLATLALVPRIKHLLADARLQSNLVQAYAANHSLQSAVGMLGLSLRNGAWALWVLAIIGLLISLAPKNWLNPPEISGQSSAHTPEKMSAPSDPDSGFRRILLLFSLLLAGGHVLPLALFKVSAINLTNLIIAACIPVCLLIGRLVQQLLPVATEISNEFRRKPLRTATLVSTGLAFCLLGAYTQVGMIKPVTVLLHPQDQAAMNWIAANTRPEDIFLIDCQVFEQPSKCEPIDSGGWITALTGYATLSPPTALAEQDLKSWLIAQPASHMYTATSSGQFRPGMLDSIPELELVYSQGGVMIYKRVVSASQ